MWTNASAQRRVMMVGALLSCLLQPLAWGAEKQLRIGSLVPKNSVYHRQLMELGEVWKKGQEARPSSTFSRMAPKAAKPR